MTKIWKKKFEIHELNAFSKDSIVSNMGIEFLEKGPDFISAAMPVDNRTKQPLGILHGGASVVLAETLGSVASYMTLEDSSYSVGMEVNANHLKSVTKGRVTGVVKPVHLGKTTQVWDITIKNEAGKPVCISRLTMAILKTPSDNGLAE
ncbi:MAG: hotdog fold thioesterase [Desulfobacula sp.]|jgi:1,4-dihydroxy-2-naphthoyl-CoA hydrolase|nr:hotdog fold thioesterase [Desulfobacula sp.]MDA8135372.1 hotdog fold thioesterase [Desulfobacteraceae bacterium]